MSSGPTAGRRRAALGALGGIACVAMLPAARATPAAMRAAIDDFTGGAAPAERDLRLQVPEIVENGNSVPVEVELDLPMTDTLHVRRIALFSERNPQPQVAEFRLGPHNGRARVATRLRMADSQRLVAVAELSDGRFVQRSVDVLVTLAACIETP